MRIKKVWINVDDTKKERKGYGEWVKEAFKMHVKKRKLLEDCLIVSLSNDERMKLKVRPLVRCVFRHI